MLPPVGFKSNTIDFEAARILNPLITSYINGDEKLKSLYQYRPDISAFEEAMRNRNTFPFYRETLVNVLKRQNRHFSDQADVQNSINSLADPGTFTVTTGHQLCLFTGPLYFIYKIISVIRLAEALNEKYSDNHFVPVYWMASEDHDFDEISSVNIYNRDFKWELESKGPVGRLSADSLQPLLNELKTVMGDSDHALELFKLFEEAYLFNRSLADATRFLVNRLFAGSGLVIIDGDDAELKKLFAPLMRKELIERKAIDLVSEASQVIQDAGAKPQVNPRAVNLFYIEDNLRERIIVNDDCSFVVNNTELAFSEEEMLALLDEHPEKFSPNVILRPVYEEYILPGLSYTGGPGELSYWLQYKKVFEYFGVHYPVLMLRSSVILTDSNMEKKMDALSLTVSDLFEATDDIIKKFISKNVLNELDFSQEEKALQSVFEKLREKITAVDPVLESSVAAELQKTLNSMQQLSKKANAAVKRKHETSISQIRGLKEKVFPKGVYQERILNITPYYIKHGRDFIDLVMQELSVVPSGVNVISLG